MSNQFKCDTCGKFISYVELSEGGGSSQCFIPDSDVSYEEIGFRCKMCTSVYGKIRPVQFGDIESNSWVN